MAKSFSSPPAREPRSLETDPAFRAAVTAYGSQTVEPVAAVPAATPVAQAVPKSSDSEPDSALMEFRRPGRQPTKRSVYPTQAQCDRLAEIRMKYSVAETFVIEYAIERLFATETDEAIARELRSRGKFLRRAVNR